MPKQLLLEFTDYEKDFNVTKNAKVAEHVRQPSPRKDVTQSADYVSADCQKYFASARVAYYGDDWLRLLFQTLFINSRGHDGKS